MEQWKRDFLVDALPAVIPLARAGIIGYYEKQEIKRNEEYAVMRAEHRKQKLTASATQAAESAETADAPESRAPEPTTSDPDVQTELDALEAETACSFCRNVIDALRDEPPEVARQGIEELEAFENVQDQLTAQGASPEEVERAVDEVMEGWEAIPDVLGMEIV